jgi:hypothetical protein
VRGVERSNEQFCTEGRWWMGRHIFVCVYIAREFPVRGLGFEIPIAFAFSAGFLFVIVKEEDDV